LTLSRFSFLSVWLGVAWFLPAPAVRGQTVVNGTFAAPTQSPGGFQYNPSSGTATWAFVGNSGISSSTGPWAPPGGASSQFAFLQITSSSPTNFSQTVTFASAGSFTLSYLEGTRNGYPGTNYLVTLTSNADSSVALSASDSSSTGQAFATAMYSFTVPASGDYILKFAAVSGGDFTDRSTVFDNIVIAAVPEPAAYATVLGVMALGCVVWRRGRKR